LSKNKKQNENIPFYKNKTMPKKESVYVIVLLAILARVLLTAIDSYEGDIAGYYAWSLHLFEYGPSKFYETFHVVYAPFYLYVLWLSGGIEKMFSMNSDTAIYFIKLTASGFDFLGGYFIYLIAKKHNLNRLGFYLGILYSLNPGVFFNSSIWGQFDGLQATFLLITLYILETQKKRYGILAFTIAILTKPQSGILAPIILFYLFKDIESFDTKKIWHNTKEFLVGIAYSIVAYTVLILPFYYTTDLHKKLSTQFGSFIGRIGDFYMWMYTLYSKSVDDYPYATANAFNFWTLAGGQPIDDGTMFITVLGNSLTYKKTGLIIFTICCLFTAIYFYLGRNRPETPYFSSFFVILSGFFFATRMHERYLLPSIIFLTVSMIWYQKHIVTLVLVSLAVTFNHWYIYDLSFKKIYWIENFDPVAMRWAVVTFIAVIISLVYMSYGIIKFKNSETHSN
jgi:Gpi18-like mannosyltransferase